MQSLEARLELQLYMRVQDLKSGVKSKKVVAGGGVHCTKLIVIIVKSVKNAMTGRVLVVEAMFRARPKKDLVIRLLFLVWLVGASFWRS